MLKITILDGAGVRSVVRLEGRLGGPWVAEMRSSCDQICSQGAGLEIDLGGVSFVDDAGIELLHWLERRGATFLGMSPFVAAQFSAYR